MGSLQDPDKVLSQHLETKNHGRHRHPIRRHSARHLLSPERPQLPQLLGEQHLQTKSTLTCAVIFAATDQKEILSGSMAVWPSIRNYSMPRPRSIHARSQAAIASIRTGQTIYDSIRSRRGISWTARMDRARAVRGKSWNKRLCERGEEERALPHFFLSFISFIVLCTA